MKKLFYSMFMLAAMLSFTACEDVPAPYDIPNASGGESGDDADYSAAAGSGTLADPFNTTAILKLASELDADAQSDQEYYFKGKVVSVTEQFGTQYGNATFYMSDDGTTKNQFYVFRALYFNNKKYTSGTTLKEGDEVVVCGKVTNFKGNTPETVQGSCYVYSINGTGGGGGSSAETIGTIDNPKSVSDVVTIINSMADNQTSNELYYVKGTIKQIKTTDENIAKYKNIDYIITDGKTDITVYHGRNLDNTEFTGPGQINVNDEVIVLGNLQKYVNANTGAVTPELAQGNYIVKLTKGSGGGGGETPSTDAKKVTVAEFNAAEVNDNVWYQLTGTVENLKDGDQYGNFDLKDETGSVYVYGLLSEKGGEKKKFQDLAAAKGIKNGSKITIIGTRGVFNDKIEVMNAYFVSIEGGGGSGEQGGGGQVSGNSITFSAQGYQNQQDFDGQSITLGDAKLSFSKGSGSTTPKYYSTGTAMRLYGGNTLTISSSKTISKVEFTYCEDYNGTSFYPTADNSTVTPGTYDYSTHTWTGSANEIVLSRSASTGHFRIVSITITYAK